MVVGEFYAKLNFLNLNFMLNILKVVWAVPWLPPALMTNEFLKGHHLPNTTTCLSCKQPGYREFKEIMHNFIYMFLKTQQIEYVSSQLSMTDYITHRNNIS